MRGRKTTIISHTDIEITGYLVIVQKNEMKSGKCKRTKRVEKIKEEEKKIPFGFRRCIYKSL